MGFKLPPVNTLRLFEAAARLGSFKLAAEEIHLTPSAVSHGIRTLESWIGTELFHRASSGLSLTPAGEAYAPEVRRALALIAQATHRVSGRRATGTLSVSVPAGFANRWLLPRLSRFTDRHPNISVTISTARRDSDPHVDGCDLAVKMSASPGAGEAWTELMRQMLVPICSPMLRQRMSFARSDLEFLRRAPQIHVTNAGDDWAAWFRSKGLDFCLEGRMVGVDTVQLAQEAAVQGVGIAVGRRPFIDEHLQNGTLVEVAGPAVPAEARYWLVGAHASSERPEIRQFRAWILEELRSAQLTGAPGYGSASPRPAAGRLALAGQLEHSRHMALVSEAGLNRSVTEPHASQDHAANLVQLRQCS